MLLNHSPRSLCLIDEFGKGTAPIDGIALLGSVISHFATQKAKALFVLHFTEVLHPEILNPTHRQSIEVFNMACHSDSDDDDGSQALPLYKLKLGLASSSQGIPCAKSAGIPEEIIARAYEVKAAIERGESITAVESVSHSCLKSSSHRLAIQRLLEVDWTRDDCGDALRELKALLKD